MDDAAIQERIDELAVQQRRLREEADAGVGVSDEDRARLRDIEVELDRLWDLRRQRDARREFGQDVDDTHERSARTVEDYRN